MRDQYIKFQFHKGTIRTLRGFGILAFPHEFQFHKGTIRTWHLLLFFDSDEYFNSIKVQLEPSAAVAWGLVSEISIP